MMEANNAPSNDNRRVRYRGGHPALRVLIKERPLAALAAMNWMRAKPEHCSEAALPLIHLDLREHTQDDAETFAAPEELWGSLDDVLENDHTDDPINIDKLHEVTPELHELLRCAGGIAWPWSGSRARVDGKIKWRGEPWCYEWTEAQRRVERHVMQLGGLTYFTQPEARRRHPGGMLVSYTNDNGITRQPNYKATKPRGGKRPYRTVSAVDDYLTRPGATASPLTAEGLRSQISDRSILMPMLTPLDRRGPSDGIDIHNQIDTLGRFGVEEAREYLRHYGIDGAIAFDDLPFPATKCRPGTAKGARFIAGVSAGKATQTAPALGKMPEPLSGLSKVAEEVLEEVAARGNLTRIGMRLGKSKGYADRYGRKALLAAADELLALNDNSAEKIIAA
jgi:hypothetical protein